MKVKNIPSGPLMVNTYLVWDDTNKGFIVDPGGLNEKIINSIEEENIDLEYIILTHGHCDHIGGVLAVQENIIVKLWPQELNFQCLKIIGSTCLEIFLENQLNLLRKF